MSEVFVSTIEYALGEQDAPYQNASGFGEVGMPDMPQIWGWGNFRSTQQTAHDLEKIALRDCLAKSTIDPEHVDAILRCSAIDTKPELSNNSGELLKELGLSSAYPVHLSANGCDAFLIGVQQAAAMVQTKQAGLVLVVCSDTHPTEVPRFQRAGIFSDAACACLVSATPLEDAYRITGSVRKADPGNMYPDAGFQSSLAQKMNEDLFLANEFPLSSVSKVFTNNLFLPITLTKEQEAGFESEQVFTDIVARIGHCYSADPFINLADFSRQGLKRPGDTFLLVSDAPGVRSGLALLNI